MNANFEEFLIALARNSAAAGVLVLLVLAAQRGFQKHLSPHWRCALWLLVVVRLLPFSLSSDTSILNLLPHWGPANPSVDGTGLAAPKAALLLNQTATPPNSETIFSGDTDAAAGMEPASAEPEMGLFANWTWGTSLFFGWLAGVITLAGYVAAVSISLTRSLARLRPLDDPIVLNVLRDCCRRMGIRRAPVLMVGDVVRTPALHGLLRPRLLLPVGFTTQYSAAEQRFVFLHELAHLRRHDLLLNWIMTALQIVHWFNPLVWLGFSRWRVDREIACDAAALAAAGARSNRAYGETILRLLQHLSARPSIPGLVGILEDKRQLHRRMKMIASFAPSRRPFAAMGLMAILAMVGLTDAQVAQTTTPAAPSTGAAAARSAENAVVPQPIGPYVLFLINGAETMLGAVDPAGQSAGKESADYIERGRSYDPEFLTATDEQKRTAVKWQVAAQTLQGLLMGLPMGTEYRVVLFRGSSPLSLGVGMRDGTDADTPEIEGIVRRLRTQTPIGRFDLEAAFGSVSRLANEARPERIVLLTDGLPTAGAGVRSAGSVTEADRIKFFEAATKVLPPRIPVHTVLLPLPPGDPGAAGLYWGLANHTRGGLTCPATSGSDARTHLAFVIDTSGSMRDPNNGGLWPAVIQTMEAALVSDPQLTGVQLLDGDGRFILGRKGTGKAGWLPNTPETRDAIKRVLRRYNQDTVSNPVPGIYNAIRFLQDKDALDLRMGIYVLGDEFNSSDRASVVLDRVDVLNPRDATGRRPVTISAIGFPTTIRYQFSMGNTGLRFANLMRQLTHEHGGSFVAFPDL